MPYLVGAQLPQMPAGERFRTLLARPGILQTPGAHSGLAALQAKAAAVTEQQAKQWRYAVSEQMLSLLYQ